MAKSDVLALAQIIASDQADPAHLERYYDEVLRELGQEERWLSTFTLVQANTGTATYDLPAEAITLLAVYYDDRELAVIHPDDTAAVLGANWRDRIGRPVAYTTDQYGSKEFRIVPAPDRDSAPFIPVWWAPFGLDYPNSSAAVLITDRRADVPRYLDLYLALLIVEREFKRDSTHTDATFADACAQVAMLIKGMVG